MRYFVGIESSCDETAVGVFDAEQNKLLSNSIFSQIDLHKKYGGVMPEVASRSHLEQIQPVFQAALDEAGINIDQVDCVGVTTHPGLHGSLLVGICFAKALALSKNIPILSIDHNYGHIVSALFAQDRTLRSDVEFPYLCLSVSGGHTSFYLVNMLLDYQVLGETVDDAAGEAFDKVAKLLGLSYPGGPIIERLAAQVGNQDFFKYPRNKNKDTLDFSFSGLKTAVLYSLVKMGVYDKRFNLIPENLSLQIQQQVSSSFQACVVDIFLQKLDLALQRYPQVSSIFLVGGVSCNKFVMDQLGQFSKKRQKTFFSPPREFCTDNGAMIALATFLQYQNRARHKMEDVDLQRRF